MVRIWIMMLQYKQCVGQQLQMLAISMWYLCLLAMLEFRYIVNIKNDKCNLLKMFERDREREVVSRYYIGINCLLDKQ